VISFELVHRGPVLVKAVILATDAGAETLGKAAKKGGTGRWPFF
jgi:hypothetical protein